jgi:hypothetical protein
MENKPKILGFMTIHYGMCYLEASLLSVRDHVDKMVIAYSYNPSHGFSTDLSCPDTRDEIYEVCSCILGDKLIWDEADSYPHEAYHRDVRYKYSKDFSIIYTVDADEVLEEKDISTALEYVNNNSEKYYGIDGYYNFFRSFSWVCTDGFRPIRFEKLDANNQLQNLNCKMRIYHFSTAQREEIMRYKYNIFGHASEIKPNWLDEVFYKWSPENNFGDLHPVSIGLWNAVPFDKKTLPKVLLTHPNYIKDII